jgi:RHS repeat-associated protein
VYSDVLGRTISTVTRSFDGGFSEAVTEYDSRGRVHRASKPHLAPDPSYWTVTDYDGLNRPWQVTQDLGVIDGSGNPASSIVTTSYTGSESTVTYTAGQIAHQRSERKNLLGKVDRVIDGNGATISYVYDVDGNLTETDDPSHNKVQLGYESRRGWKTLARDPDLGEWHYTYTGFGDLETQTDAIGQTTTMAYDKLGRMVKKTDSSGAGTAEWVYDTAPGAGRGKLAGVLSAPDSRLNGTCGILNSTVTGGNRAARSYKYTQFGDLEEVSECVDGETFLTTYGYDEFGRQNVVRYPTVRTSRFAVRYNYTGLGYLHYVSDADASSDAVYWVAKGVNAAGQVTAEETRNGVETVSNRNPATGWLLGSSSTAHADHETLIQNWSYSFDQTGNLLGRSRADKVNLADSQETFQYDALDRLTRSEVNVAADEYQGVESYVYDNLGNLTSKGAKTYTYTGCQAGTRTAGPHAVCSITGGSPFIYDANGNMTGNADRSIEYNFANKVRHIDNHPSPSQGNDTGFADFMYGADGNRVVQSVGGGGASARTVYVGLGGTGKSIYERTTSGNAVEHVHFIYAGGVHGGSAFALRVVTGSVTENVSPPPPPPTISTKFNHFDHLGSVTATSDETGHVVDPAHDPANAGVMGYDPWGARRNPSGQTASPTSFNLPVGRRGFTGHETIPNVGIVNMNGRVYDPVIGRFLSPDPNVQFAADLQSYNRYSYVLNNPLRYADPTGYFLDGGFDTIVNIAIGVTSLAVCGTGVGCVFAFAALATIYNTSSMINSGVAWDQAVTLGIAGLAVGTIGGAIGGMIGGAVGEAASNNQLVGRIVAGSVGATLSASMMAGMTGGSLSAGSLLSSAFQGAAWGAVAWGLTRTNPVTKAAEAEAKGGGGSGAAKMEKAETVDSVLADAGHGGSSESEVLDLVRPRDWTDDIKFLMSRDADHLGNPLSADDVIRVMVSIDRINNTPNGAAELAALADKGTTVMSAAPGGKPASYGSEIMVDPTEHLRLYTDNPRGWDPAILESQIAHEGGHLLGGLDAGPRGMNNTIQYENPVRTDLGLYPRNRMGFAP